jgi:hypothetical protein
MGTHAIEVVVIGGSFAGRRVAQLLEWSARMGQLNVRVTLVHDKSFWEYTPSVLRCLVTGKADGVLVPTPAGQQAGAAQVPASTILRIQEGHAISIVARPQPGELDGVGVRCSEGSRAEPPLTRGQGGAGLSQEATINCKPARAFTQHRKAPQRYPAPGSWCE